MQSSCYIFPVLAERAACGRYD